MRVARNAHGAGMRWAAYLEVLCADGGHVGDAQNEADGVEDVGLAGTVEAGDGVKALVPAPWLSAHASGSEGLQSSYHPEMTVRTAYDLKPCCCTCQSHILSHVACRIGVGQRGRTSMITSMTLMAAAALGLGLWLLSSSSSSSSLSRQEKGAVPGVGGVAAERRCSPVRDTDVGASPKLFMFTFPTCVGPLPAHTSARVWRRWPVHLTPLSTPALNPSNAIFDTLHFVYTLDMDLISQILLST